MKSLQGIGPVRRNVARGLALGVLVGTAGLGMAGTATAAPTNNFDLSAQGDGMYILFAGGTLPAGLPGPVSPYAAFSTVNSNAVSKAFAGAPYLGPLLQTLPGLVGGLSVGQVPPLPELPGYVQSQDPNVPSARQAQGPYLLTANSTELSSNASAGVGAAAQADGNPQAFAKTLVTANDDSTTIATATAGATGVVIGPVSILDVSSNVSITTDATGKPTIINSTNLGTISVAGIKVGLTEKGFTILGSNVDTPQAALFNTINTLLAAQRTKIDLLPSSQVKDEATGQITVQSGALRMESIQDVPGLGDVNTTYIFGRSTVRTINGGAGTESTTGGDTGTTTDGGTTGATGGATGGTTAGDTSGGTTDSSGGGLTPVDPSTTGGDTTGGAVAEPPVFPEDPAAPVTGTPLTPVDGTSGGGTGGGTVVDTLGGGFDSQLGSNTELLYLVLVLGGGAAFLGQQLFSRFGVQLMLRQG
jgi:hypothetical protein